VTSAALSILDVVFQQGPAITSAPTVLCNPGAPSLIGLLFVLFLPRIKEEPEPAT
jgi:hypothetical protein